MHVFNLNRQERPGWPITLPSSNASLQVADIDGSGGAEVLVGNNWLYDGAGQLRPGWPAPTAPGSLSLGRFQMVALDPASAVKQIVSYGNAPNPATGEWVYAVDVRQQDNSRFAGNWPAYLEAHIGRARVGSEFLQYSGIYARTAQLVSGGTREIVLCYDRIRVLAADGTSVAALPRSISTAPAGVSRSWT